MLGRQLAIALGLVLVSAPAAVAEGPASGAPRSRVGKVGLRVMQIFPDSHQALVFDKDTGRHVVLGEGDKLGKYEVVEIEDDQVVVQVGAREIVLVAEAATPAPAPTATGERTLVDPYAPAPSVMIEVAGPIDPYAPMMQPSLGATIGMLDPRAPVREVLAPSGQRAVSAPVDPYAAPAPAPAVAPVAPVAAPVEEYADDPELVAEEDREAAEGAPAPVEVAPPVESVPPAPAIEAIRVESFDLRRAELSAALSDFDKLAKELGFAKTAGGVRLSRVPEGSYFHRLGFRAGDVVTAIDGAPLRTLDDAAAVYVRLGSAKKLAVEIDRAAAHGTLKFALK